MTDTEAREYLERLIDDYIDDNFLNFDELEDEFELKQDFIDWINGT